MHHKHWLKFSANVSVEGTRLFRFCKENGFRQLVKEPTHEAGHLLDVVLTDMAEIERARVLPRVADHNIVRFVMHLCVIPQAQQGRRVYEYKRAPWKRICEELGDRDWSWIRSSDVDLATERFTRETPEVIEAPVPSKLIFGRAAVHPWYNERCRELIQEKRQAEGTPAYKDVVEKCSQGIFQEYCKYTAQTREKLRQLRRGSKQ